jgi:ABC-type multidrug transport system ATPase subunit
VFITFSYYSTATRVMWEFNRIYRNLEGALTDAAQFAELLLDPPAVTDVPAPIAFAPSHSGVEFRAVSFRYSPAQPLLFDRFSLTIEPGTRLGLVGRSGGGKTTLTRLLLRFSDVEAGEILVGGLPIDRVAQAALRQTIAYVPQDPAMFHRSIADNIRVGRPGANDAAVREAARLAHASEFIEALPDGYRTLVGERGIKLSGGQRQRVAIARAILKDAPILVLDEATSSLDSESEALIQDALWTLMSKRTAIVIAHRLSTVRRMDRLIILDRGRIAEHGSHDALLAAGGTYATLWAHQSAGFCRPWMRTRLCMTRRVPSFATGQCSPWFFVLGAWSVLGSWFWFDQGPGTRTRKHQGTKAPGPVTRHQARRTCTRLSRRRGDDEGSVSGGGDLRAVSNGHDRPEIRSGFELEFFGMGVEVAVMSSARQTSASLSFQRPTA